MSVDVTFTDISKVLEKLSHLGLVKKLSSFRIAGAVQEWINNFL